MRNKFQGGNLCTTKQLILHIEVPIASQHIDFCLNQKNQNDSKRLLSKEAVFLHIKKSADVSPCAKYSKYHFS